MFLSSFVQERVDEEEEGDQGGGYVEGDEGYDDGEGGGGEGGYDDEENYGPTVDELIDRGQQEQLRLQVRVAMCEEVQCDVTATSVKMCAAAGKGAQVCGCSQM